jgi:hypothetical protein
VRSTFLHVTRHSSLVTRAVLALCASLLLPGFSHSACALETERVESAYVEKQFRCEVIALIDAPASAVEAVLRDYESYPELDDRILQARVLARPTPTTAMLETKLRACFGPFCRTVRRVEEVLESPQALSATTDPDRSDVRFGETHTSIEAIDGDRTRVVYRTSIVPDFWVPALGGRRWMLETMESATLTLFRNVEVRARDRTENLP